MVLDLTFSILKASGYPEFARASELEYCAKQLDGMIRREYPVVTNEKTRLEIKRDVPYSVEQLKDGNTGEVADFKRFLVNFIRAIDGVEFELAYLPGRDTLMYIINRKGIFD